MYKVFLSHPATWNRGHLKIPPLLETRDAKTHEQGIPKFSVDIWQLPHILLNRIWNGMHYTRSSWGKRKFNTPSLRLHTIFERILMCHFTNFEMICKKVSNILMLWWAFRTDGREFHLVYFIIEGQWVSGLI